MKLKYNDTIVNVRINKDFKERIEFLAKQEDRSLSSLIRYLLIQYMKVNESNFDVFEERGLNTNINKKSSLK